MSYIDATMQFPPDRLGQAFVSEYLSRYTDPATGWAAAHWDESEQTRRRQASLFDGTIVPTPIKDGPEPADFAVDTRPVVALQISCGWPEAFLTDLQRNPQPEPDLFGGITIIE